MITNLKGEPINFAKSIEIGKHVWIGKDTKLARLLNYLYQTLILSEEPSSSNQQK